MDASILTIFFCFILLVLNTLLLVKLRTIHSNMDICVIALREMCKAVQSIETTLDQMEKKEDLILGNVPPSDVVEPKNWREQLHKPGTQIVCVPAGEGLHWVNGEDAPEAKLDNKDLDFPRVTLPEEEIKPKFDELKRQLILKASSMALQTHNSKVSTTMPKRKRGRPKKTPNVKID